MKALTRKFTKAVTGFALTGGVMLGGFSSAGAASAATASPAPQFTPHALQQAAQQVKSDLASGSSQFSLTSLKLLSQESVKPPKYLNWLNPSAPTVYASYVSKYNITYPAVRNDNGSITTAHHLTVTGDDG